MPSLKEIKNRIASVNSTRKITSAMKMVASSKLHHAQVQIEKMLPYENMLEHIVKTFLASDADAGTIYELEREVKKVVLVVFASNSLIYPIRRKVAEKVTKLGYRSAGDFSGLADKPNSAECIRIATELGAMFRMGEVDKVELIYHHFKSAGSQVLTRKTLLPIDVETIVEEDHERDLTSTVITKKAQDYLKKHHKEETVEHVEAKPLNDNFIVEPDMDTVLGVLVPKVVHLALYTALLDSNASEHAARMVAMQTATDNADELLRELNLQYNKSIVGGTVNN